MFHQSSLQKLSSSIFGLAAGLLAMLLAGRAAADAFSQPDDFVVQVWDTDSGLPHSTVTSIAQTPDGYLWVGTLHGGLARFDGERFVNFHPGNTPELKSIEIHKLLMDADGTLWIGNVEGGLISYRAGKFRFEYWNNDTPRSWVDAILSSKPGTMELSSRPGLIFRRSGRCEHESLGDDCAAKHPSDCDALRGCQRHDLVSHGQGDAGAHCKEPMLISLLRPGLRSPVINALTKDASGRIWVGTDKEIAVWDGTTLRT